MLDECDVVVPLDKIAPYVEYVYGVGEKFGLRIESFGHAGDGNLHIYIIGDDKISVADFKAKADEFFDDIYAAATRVGGLVSGEHASIPFDEAMEIVNLITLLKLLDQHR